MGYSVSGPWCFDNLAGPDIFLMRGSRVRTRASSFISTTRFAACDEE